MAIDKSIQETPKNLTHKLCAGEVSPEAICLLPTSPAYFCESNQRKLFTKSQANALLANLDGSLGNRENYELCSLGKRRDSPEGRASERLALFKFLRYL